MINIFSWMGGIFRGASALSDKTGEQRNEPTETLNDGIRPVGVDSSLQIAAVWACIDRIASTISTLPLFVYDNVGNRRVLARGTPLYTMLHDSPNAMMTPVEFWGAMLLNLLLRGNAYARVERDSNGVAYALIPMSADQTQQFILDDGTVLYRYMIGSEVAILAAENVLHIKGLGNGKTGLSRLDYMRSTLDESRNAQGAANTLFSKGGKPTGVLMVDNVLNKEQRIAVQKNFGDIAAGGTGRLFVLEANMKYQQLSLSPEDMQLLSTRQFSKQEIGTWFGVPGILINQTEGTTTLGSSSGEIIESFYKLTIRPLLVAIEQAIAKRVLTSAQRVRYTVEFSQDALLRASLKDRMDIYAKATQNGIKTRNECRQLENDPPIEGGDELTAQSNLAPLRLLGKINQGAGNARTQDAIAQ
ncbi:MAG TPA: phage portal protein [Denitromonas sp.]|nr:phage portal protein [Denitromonas sp.]